MSPAGWLTAGHCAAYWPDEVRFGQDAAHPDVSIAVSASLVAPGFDPQTLADDLGVIVLSGLAPSDLAWRGAAPLPSVGAQARVVGFGVSAADASDSGLKRQGTTTIVAEEDATRLTLGTSPASVCQGDSGGPVFVTGRDGEMIAGVVSSGDPRCAVVGHATRVDRFADFVSGVLGAVQDDSRNPGERCLQPKNCARGTCYEPSDAPGFSYCASSCATTADCIGAMTCRGGLCRFPTPSPGAVGSACTSESDCTTALCARATDAGTGTCSEPCLPGGMACPAGTTCSSRIGEALCLPVQPRRDPTASGGCCVFAGPPRAASMLPLAALTVLFGLRRSTSLRRAVPFHWRKPT